MILNVFKVLIHAYFFNSLFIFWFTRIIFLSVTITCYSEHFAFSLKSCAIYFYLRFSILFSHMLFFYLWLQYFRRESPLPGRGLGVCPLHRYVRRPAGPRRPHLPGFIIWKFRPSRPGSFLHYGLTLLIWQTSMGICLLVRSWPSIELQVCSDFRRLLKAGLTSMSLTLLPSAGLPYTILGPSWCLRQVQVLVVPLA